MVVKLFIRDPRGEITEIELRDSEFESCTVLQLKTKIREKTGRDGSQELIFKWCLLKDATKLCDYGIEHESTIYLGTQHFSKQFFIKDLSGRIDTFCLDEDEFKSSLVWQLKCMIQEPFGIPADQQILIYGGKQLAEDRTLSDCGIINESTIHLVLWLRGGGPYPEEGAGGMGDKGDKNRSMEELSDL